MTIIHHYTVIQNSLIALTIFYVSSIHLRPLLNAWQPPTLPILKCYIIGLTQYVTFSNWFLSLSDIHLNFLFVIVWLYSSFFFFLVQNTALLFGCTTVC